MGSDYKWKIVLVGDFAVGKTSLIRRFVYDQFSDIYLTTIGVKVTQKDLVINNTISTSLLVWDIAGSDKFTKILPQYIKGASAGLIVADLTRKDTIENMSMHAELLHEVNPHMHIFAAMNKSDLVDNTDDSLTLAKNILKEHNIEQVTPTSAKDDLNIEYLFNEICHTIYTGIVNKT